MRLYLQSYQPGDLRHENYKSNLNMPRVIEEQTPTRIPVCGNRTGAVSVCPFIIYAIMRAAPPNRPTRRGAAGRFPCLPRTRCRRGCPARFPMNHGIFFRLPLRRCPAWRFSFSFYGVILRRAAPPCQRSAISAVLWRPNCR
jgi:hypothetical protein